MSEAKFKVGDVVRVVHGNWTKSISAPTKIEKEHAKNGNLKVGEHWYSKHGHRRGGDPWHMESLVLDGSVECDKLMKARRFESAVNALHNTLWEDLPADLVHEIHEKVSNAKRGTK